MTSVVRPPLHCSFQGKPEPTLFVPSQRLLPTRCCFASSARSFLPAVAAAPRLLFWVSQLAKKWGGGRAEFWELWNTGGTWEVTCPRVNCMQRRMCSLHCFLRGAAPSRCLAFSWNAGVLFVLEVSHADCQTLQEKSKFFERLGNSNWNLTWQRDWELSFWIWWVGQAVVSTDPQNAWTLLNRNNQFTTKM